LDDAAGSDDVRRGHPVNFASFYLFEETGHRSVLIRGIIVQP
jgi:hypothetical protein